MGRWFGAVAVIGALLGGASGCAGASEAGRDIKSIVPGTSSHDEGVVSSASRDQIELVGLKNHREPVTFRLGDKTEIERDGDAVGINELKPGTPVRVSYEAAEGAETVSQVEVLTGPEGDKVRAEAKQRGAHVP